MGYFRVYKLSDYSLDECRKRCRELLIDMKYKAVSIEQVEKFAREWAEFRELQARHNGENKK